MAINRSITQMITQNRVWQSIFSQGYPRTEEGRAKVIINNLFLHIHPVKVKKHSLKLTYTWGLGVISTYLFMVLAGTGVWLMFFYAPSAERAYTDIQNLETAVTFGMLMRNMHRWSAHLMVLLVFFHLCRVFFTGGYKRPREFNWIIGVFLWVATLMLSFTGYLLTWDQLSYWAITVSTNIVETTPLIGDKLRLLLLGAKETGPAALIRFYALHVAVLPLVMTILIGVHFWKIRKDGGLSSPMESAEDRWEGGQLNKEIKEAPLKDPAKTYGLMELVKGTSPMVEKGPEDTVMSWPHLLILEVLAVLGTTVFLLFLSLLVDAPLREFANPDVTENPAKAAWYFLNLQELLLHMHPALAGVFIPGLIIVILAAIPYIDRSKEDIGQWFASKKGRSIALFSAIYTAVWSVVLILFDEYVRVRSLISEPEIWPGWVIPIVVIGGLIALLYAMIRRWRPSAREAMIGLFTAFVVCYFILIVSALFFRGLGMHLTWPWTLPPGALSF